MQNIRSGNFGREDRNFDGNISAQQSNMWCFTTFRQGPLIHVKCFNRDLTIVNSWRNYDWKNCWEALNASYFEAELNCLWVAISKAVHFREKYLFHQLSLDIQGWKVNLSLSKVESLHDSLNISRQKMLDFKGIRID